CTRRRKKRPRFWPQLPRLSAVRRPHGVSTDGGSTIYGFNPDGGGVPVWQLMDGLKNGDAFPGVVRDDTAAFSAAQARGLTVLSFEVILPEPQFQRFEGSLDGERRGSQYSYGFP